MDAINVKQFMIETNNIVVQKLSAIFCNTTHRFLIKKQQKIQPSWCWAIKFHKSTVFVIFVDLFLMWQTKNNKTSGLDINKLNYETWLE